MLWSTSRLLECEAFCWRTFPQTSPSLLSAVSFSWVWHIHFYQLPQASHLSVWNQQRPYDCSQLFLWWPMYVRFDSHFHCFPFSYLCCTLTPAGQFPLLMIHFCKLSCGFITGPPGDNTTACFAVCAYYEMHGDQSWTDFAGSNTTGHWAWCYLLLTWWSVGCGAAASVHFVQSQFITCGNWNFRTTKCHLYYILPLDVSH